MKTDNTRRETMGTQPRHRLQDMISDDVSRNLNRMREALIEFSNSDNASSAERRTRDLVQMFSNTTFKRAVWVPAVGFYCGSEFSPLRFHLGATFPDEGAVLNTQFAGFFQWDGVLHRVLVLNRHDLFRFLGVVPDSGYPFSSSGYYMVVHGGDHLPRVVPVPRWTFLQTHETEMDASFFTMRPHEVVEMKGDPRPYIEAHRALSSYYTAYSDYK